MSMNLSLLLISQLSNQVGALWERHVSFSVVGTNKIVTPTKEHWVLQLDIVKWIQLDLLKCPIPALSQKEEPKYINTDRNTADVWNTLPFPHYLSLAHSILFTYLIPSLQLPKPHLSVSSPRNPLGKLSLLCPNGCQSPCPWALYISLKAFIVFMYFVVCVYECDCDWS